MRNQKGFSLVEGLLIVLIISVVGFAGYYVFSSQDDDEVQSENSSQVNNNQETAESTEVSEDSEPAEESPDETKEETGGVYASGYRNENSRILVDFLIEEGFDSYWVEFGQTPENLSEKTQSKSEGLGYDFEGGYGGFTVVIDPASLPSGDNIYFYRIAASKDGTTYYTGLNSFNYK